MKEYIPETYAKAMDKDFNRLSCIGAGKKVKGWHWILVVEGMMKELDKKKL